VSGRAVLDRHDELIARGSDADGDRSSRGVLKRVGQCLGDDPAGDLGRRGVHVHVVGGVDQAVGHLKAGHLNLPYECRHQAETRVVVWSRSCPPTLVDPAGRGLIAVSQISGEQPG
jgi:hypothetical protein